MNNMLYFSMSELIHSDMANTHNINNTPNSTVMDNLLNLIFYCLQPIREKIGKPMIITSGYRNQQLNKLVGGTENSQHKKGQAVDFYIPNMSIKDTINKIAKLNIEYDQLINEKNSWVHISFAKHKNRKQILIL